VTRSLLDTFLSQGHLTTSFAYLMREETCSYERRWEFVFLGGSVLFHRSIRYILTFHVLSLLLPTLLNCLLRMYLVILYGR
jgi:hypothetical protein